MVTTPIPEVLTYFRSPRRSQPVWELHLERELTAQKDELAAYALAYDTHVAALGSDAIEVRLQHREGAAMTVQAPYSKRGSTVEIGDLIAQSATRTIW
ncbi:Uncharacterised protein [Mycobacteroides abscessus subsp. abscessus]|nr:Uncharacterised protein [Mycobacteroides abscessus subsp. abscessus]SKV37772.1 Uncharacterised protein [Mycobacteroides abscessus subsp. abscessus]